MTYNSNILQGIDLYLVHGSQHSYQLLVQSGVSLTGELPDVTARSEEIAERLQLSSCELQYLAGTGRRWITNEISEKIRHAPNDKILSFDGTMYKVSYREATDGNTNPFHTTGVIAKHCEDIGVFFQAR